jgi:hypothetical protein
MTFWCKDYLLIFYFPQHKSDKQLSLLLWLKIWSETSNTKRYLIYFPLIKILRWWNFFLTKHYKIMPLFMFCYYIGNLKKIIMTFLTVVRDRSFLLSFKCVQTISILCDKLGERFTTSFKTKTIEIFLCMQLTGRKSHWRIFYHQKFLFFKTQK